MTKQEISLKIKRYDLVAGMGLILITLAFFWRAASGHWTFFHEDVACLFYPMKSYYAECLRAGRLPLWNPYIGGGYPQFAEGQIGALYPLNLLLFGLLPLTLAYNYNVLLHYALAGLFFYAFLRRRKLGIGAAFIGAAIFQWSGFMLGHLQHPSIFCAVAWLPLLLYFLEDGLQRAAAGREVLSRVFLAGLVLAMQLLVGYPPMVFYTLLIALAYTGFCRRSLGLPFRLPALLFLGSLLVGFSLSAVQWMPTMELALSSERGAISRLLFITSFGLTPKHLPTFIFPHYLGSAAYGTYVGERHFWEVCGYIGLLPLFLAVIGAVKKWPRAWPFVIIGLIGLYLSFGPGNPIYYVLQYVPGFNLFRAAGRYLLLWTVAGAVLAAEGMEAILEQPAQGHKKKAYFAAAIASVLLIAWMVAQVRYSRLLPAYAPRPAILPAEGMLLTCGSALFLALLWAARRGAKRLIVPALAAAVLADLFAFAVPLAPVTAPSFYKIRPWTVQQIQRDTTWFRIWPSRTTLTGGSFHEDLSSWARNLDYYQWDKERLMPNINLLWQIHSLPGYAAFMRPLDYSIQLTETAAYSHQGKDYVYLRNLARLLGVKYMILRHADKEMELVEQRGGFWLYRDPRALPRAWVVGAAETYTDPASAYKRTISSSFDPRRSVILEEAPPAPLSRPGEIASRLRIKEPRPERILLQTSTAADGLLVLNELYDDAWKAKLDGVETPIYRANIYQRAIFLPAGEHTIEFNYANIYLWAGARVSLLAIAMCGFAFLRIRRKTSKNNAPNDMKVPRPADSENNKSRSGKRSPRRR